MRKDPYKGFRYTHDIVPFYNNLGARSLLDFNYGMRSYYRLFSRALRGVNLVHPPMPFADLIVCIGMVLDEHELDLKLGKVNRLAKLGVYLAVRSDTAASHAAWLDKLRVWLPDSKIVMRGLGPGVLRVWMVRRRLCDAKT